MYNKIIKKYYLVKIFTLALPKKKKSNIASYYLCKYLISNTPYSNINIFIKEISQIVCILSNIYKKKKFLFICSNKIFFLNSINFQTHKFNFVSNKSKFLINKNFYLKNIAFVILYNINSNNKFIAFLKDAKMPSIGFINYHNQPNITDYTLLLEARFFSSIFLFHFIFKKLFYYAKN